MNAQEALKITQTNWADNEPNYLTHIVGYQQKVENAAKEGRVACSVCTVPGQNGGMVDFITSFFEQQGYFVILNPTPTGEYLVSLNWKQEPLGSRPFKEANEISQWIK